MWLSPCSLSHQNSFLSTPLGGPAFPCSTQAGSGSWYCKPSPSSWGMSAYPVNKSPTSPVHYRDRHLMKCLTSGSTDFCWLPSSCSPPLHLLLPSILRGEVSARSLPEWQRISLAKALLGRKWWGRREGTVTRGTVRRRGSITMTAMRWSLGRNTVGRGPT